MLIVTSVYIENVNSDLTLFQIQHITDNKSSLDNQWLSAPINQTIKLGRNFKK